MTQQAPPWRGAHDVLLPVGIAATAIGLSTVAAGITGTANSADAIDAWVAAQSQAHSRETAIAVTISGVGDRNDQGPLHGVWTRFAEDANAGRRPETVLPEALRLRASEDLSGLPHYEHDREPLLSDLMLSTPRGRASALQVAVAPHDGS
jgi:hypothetical protein